jgi:hypothetical protein
MNVDLIEIKRDSTDDLGACSVAVTVREALATCAPLYTIRYNNYLDKLYARLS